VLRSTNRWPRWAAAVAIAVVMGLAAPGGVASAQVPDSTTSVAVEEVTVPGGTGAGNQTDPHLDGSLLTFTSTEGTTSEIRYVDLADGSSGSIDNGGHRDSLSDVSGSLVVFRRVMIDSSERSLFVFDASAPELGVREVAPLPGARRAFSSIGGTTVAFMQFNGSSSTASEVCVADAVVLSAPAVCLTDDGTMSNRDPAVSPDGSTVAWAKCAADGTGCDIWVVQRRSGGTWGTPLQLTDSTGEDILPDTDGTMVTYTSNAGGDYDIWWEDVDGSNERQLVLSDAPGSVEGHSHIDAGSILFERELPGATNTDLYLYRLATRQLLRITSTDEQDSLNALSLTPTGELRVAWARPDGAAPGHNDIHAARAQLDDGTNAPPVLSLPAGMTVDATGPAGATVAYAATATDDSGTPSLACAPASGATFGIGTTTVSCSVTDDDGETVAGSFDVTVRGAREQLVDLLVAVSGAGPGSTLAAKIRTIVGYLPDRALPLACEPLRVFISEVRAQSGKRIPAATAAAWIEDATRIRAVLACR
jgi:HYR domain/WD40-like Beta Propeller Repeat